MSQQHEPKIPYSAATILRLVYSIYYICNVVVELKEAASEFHDVSKDRRARCFSVVDLIRTPNIRRTTLIIICLWYVCSMFAEHCHE